METVGFVFGMTGFVFAVLAMSSASSAAGKVDQLEQRIREAGILSEGNTGEDGLAS